MLLVADRVEVLSDAQLPACLSCTNNYYQLDYMVRPQKVAHILSGCGALAQSKYLSQHDSALKVLFYEMLHDLRPS